MKAITISDADDFSALVSGLAADVIDAHIYWGMAKTLREQLTQWPEVGSEAQTFWYYTQTAHRRTALASLARAYDTERSALHLCTWLVTIRQNPHLFTAEALKARRPTDPFVKWVLVSTEPPNAGQLDADISACSTSDPDVSALLRLRHNFIGHRSAELTKQAARVHAAPTPRGLASVVPQLYDDQIERLLERAVTILNRYSLLFSASGYGTKPVGHDDVERIFRGVQRDLNRMKADIEAQAALIAPSVSPPQYP